MMLMLYNGTRRPCSVEVSLQPLVREVMSSNPSVSTFSSDFRSGKRGSVSKQNSTIG